MVAGLLGVVVGTKVMSADLDAGAVRGMFKADDLKAGAPPRRDGLNITFAAEVTGAKSVSVTADGKPLLNLKDLGGGLFAGRTTVADGEAFRMRYVVDGERFLGGERNVEFYMPRPHLKLSDGGYRGTFKSLGQFESKIFAGTAREIWVYLPPGANASTEYPVLVGQDGQWDREWMATSLDNMIAWGRIPATVGVFIQPGGKDGKLDNSNRNREYDTLSDEYVRFVTEEVFPMVRKDAGLSADPAKRAIAGMSSGGICSFTACWERPDLFGNAMSFIGSYTALSVFGIEKSGVTYPAKIRKEDKKPIRVFLQDGKNDLDNPYGNWFVANLDMKAALEWKGYEVSWHPGNGFHSSEHARAIFDQALEWWLR